MKHRVLISEESIYEIEIEAETNAKAWETAEELVCDAANFDDVSNLKEYRATVYDIFKMKGKDNV